MPKTANLSLLTAAMATPEPDVEIPVRQHTASLVAQIAGLEIGDSACKVKLVDPALTIAEYATTGIELRDQLRSSVNSSLRVAKSRTNGEYEIEVAEVMTTKRMLYLLAIVTRIA